MRCGSCRIPQAESRCEAFPGPRTGHSSGGLLEARKIASMAEVYHVPITPHGVASTLGSAPSSIQLPRSQQPRAREIAGWGADGCGPGGELGLFAGLAQSSVLFLSPLLR